MVNAHPNSVANVPSPFTGIQSKLRGQSSLTLTSGLFVDTNRRKHQFLAHTLSHNTATHFMIACRVFCVSLLLLPGNYIASFGQVQSKLRFTAPLSAWKNISYGSEEVFHGSGICT